MICRGFSGGSQIALGHLESGCCNDFEDSVLLCDSLKVVTRVQQ